METQKKKVLVIDDEEDLCLLIKENLEASGQFEVYTNCDPVKAEELCATVSPDVILLDVVMPNRKGGEVAQAVRGNPATHKIPIVIMSGLGEMVYMKKRDEWKWLPNRPIVQERGDVIKEHNPEKAAEAYGVEDYITKPFVTKTLIEVLKGAIERGVEAGE